MSVLRTLAAVIVAMTAVSNPATADRREALELHTFTLPQIANPTQSLTLKFEAHVGGFRIGEIMIDAKWDGTRYVMDSSVHTEGLADVLVKARYHNSAHGIFDANRVAPKLYSTHYKTRDDQQYVRMRFNLTDPTKVIADPPYTNRHQVSRFDKYKSVDPMSSILHMVTGVTADEKNPCGKKVPIYDGKRRFDFVLRFKKEMDLASNDPEGYVGPGLHCQVQYKEVAGFRKRDAREKPYPWIDLYMARPGNGLVIPVRLTVDTGFGDLNARATQVAFETASP